MSHPIEGTPLLLAVAQASVGPRRLPTLLEEAQAWLADRYEEYDRGYERAVTSEESVAFFVEEGHWAGLAEEFEWNRREHEAVARAHREQLRHAGKHAGRRDEFDTALELREVVVVGT